jgi:Tfp pilus assembly protein PilO
VKRSVLIGCAAGAVVLILLWYFLLFAPTSKDLDDTRSEVSSVESQNQELENTIRQLKELSRNSVEQQAQLRTLRAAIPATPDLGEFILQANEIASAAGIDWLSIAPTPPAASTNGGPTSTIAISMQIQGQFSAVLDYLNRLEDLERLVVVDTINVSAASAGGATGATGADGGTSSSTSVTGAPNLSVTITGRMFTDAPPAATPGSGATTTPATPGGSTSTTPGATTPTTVPSTTPPASTSGSSS